DEPAGTLFLQHIILPRQFRRLAGCRPRPRGGRLGNRRGRRQLQSRVDEFLLILREPQPLSLVLGEELRVEHLEVDSVLVFPVLRTGETAALDRPPRRCGWWNDLQADQNEIRGSGQPPIGLRAEVRDCIPIRLRWLGRYHLDGGRLRGRGGFW